jgi:3'(2'), 5'-bisphosphate nucleotidase
MKDVSFIVPQLITLAKNVGSDIMDVYNQTEQIAIISKDDKSPLTEADMRSHRAILSFLTQATPSIPLLSEESPKEDYIHRQTWKEYWLIDPLDGTKEFLRRTGDFTVNIALISQNRPVFGLVYAPATLDLYYASKGHGAFHIRGNESAKRLSTRAINPTKTLALISRSHAESEIAQLKKIYPDITTQPMGSSLKFCEIAAGHADVYLRLGPTSEWDTAAAQCVLEEAGGATLTATGKGLIYNKDNILNPSFIVVGENNPIWSKVFEIKT